MAEIAPTGTAGEDEDTSQSTSLVLPQELTIYTVSEVHPIWVNWLASLEALAAEGVAKVQASGVEQIDAAGLQLLISLQRGVAGKSRKLSIAGASNELMTACQGLGLTDWLRSHSEGVAS